MVNFHNYDVVSRVDWANPRNKLRVGVIEVQVRKCYTLRYRDPKTGEWVYLKRGQERSALAVVTDKPETTPHIDEAHFYPVYWKGTVEDNIRYFSDRINTLENRAFDEIKFEAFWVCIDVDTPILVEDKTFKQFIRKNPHRSYAEQFAEWAGLANLTSENGIAFTNAFLKMDDAEAREAIKARITLN